MHRHLCLLALAAAGLAGTGAAWAQSRAAVAGSLEVHKVSAVATPGAERLDAAAAAQPGDVLEYAARYRNDDRGAARSFAVTLPIPAGTEFIAGSARPAGGVSASLDGKTFRPIPLMQKVRRADGSSVEMPVPLAEYRFVRWPAGDLAAGAEATFRARARVLTTDVAAAR